MPAISTRVTGTTKTGSSKLLKSVKGDFISIEAEWKKPFDIPGFSVQFKKDLEKVLGEIGDNVNKRAKLQASGAKRITKLPLVSPHRVRILSGRYRKGFLKKTKQHPTRVSASVTLGNKMFYSRYVEATTSNMTHAMLIQWKNILFKIGLQIGKTLTTWEKVR